MDRKLYTKRIRSFSNDAKDPFFLLKVRFFVSIFFRFFSFCLLKIDENDLVYNKRKYKTLARQTMENKVAIQAYSSLFQPYCSLFRPILAYSNIFQHVPSISSLFQPIPAYPSLSHNSLIRSSESSQKVLRQSSNNHPSLVFIP